jgi:hypothetical protein
MRPIRSWATAVVAGTLFLIVAGAANAATVYNNIPSPLAGNYSSEAFEARSISEFGGLVGLAPGARNNPVVTVTMSSWGCQSGGDTTCVTTPGAVFSLPITLNLYAVNTDNSVGDLLASDTQTFKIPFRPSADLDNCSGGPWFDVAEAHCYNGLAHNISWDLGGRSVTLPDKVIVTVMYNTSHHGYQPFGEHTFCYPGCAYDSLNVALMTGAPLVGSDPLPDAAYLSSTWSGAYGDGGDGGLGVFRFDPSGWTPYQPAIQIDTYPQQTGPTGPAGATGPAGPAGADGTNAVATPAVAVARPNTKLVRAKIRPARHIATFSFKGSGGTGKLSFQCRLDGGKYRTCRSGKAYKSLKSGKHVFRVRARDARGKLDLTPVTKKFRI